MVICEHRNVRFFIIYDIVCLSERNENIDLVIAEVSCPSTGLGIELGFLYDSNKPIHCIYKNAKNNRKDN